MKISYKLNALLLAAILALMLCACGKSGSDETYLGKYVCVAGEMMGFSMSGEELNAFSLELSKGGKGTMSVSGRSGSIKYSVEGNKITITISDKEVTGTIGNDTIKFEDLLGLNANITFAKEGTEAANPENYDNDLDTLKNLISDFME